MNPKGFEPFITRRVQKCLRRVLIDELSLLNMYCEKGCLCFKKNHFWIHKFLTVMNPSGYEPFGL
jgi:hypothetical protein